MTDPFTVDDDAAWCPCGCEMTYADDGFGWLCPHCDGIDEDVGRPR